METSQGTGSETGGFVPNQLATLVPSFDPSRDDVQVYSQKVSLLLNAWPENKYTELATRLILGCTGSAFNKLQIHQSEITKNDKKSIQKIIELLGGQWGQINLERRYEYVERALFRCVQKQDETADSYLARADVMWAELLAKGIELKDIQAYITLRGSQLSPDDKKRVLLDVDAASSGQLTIEKVSSAIRMLGAGFFHEITGGKRTKGKTYDQSILMAEGNEGEEVSAAFHTEGDVAEMDDEVFETLIQDSAMDGDEDASLIQDFEAATADLVQSDPDLASAYTVYTEARRRLSEKFRSRGFWPISKGKNRGFGKGVKGKFNKGHHSSRKSLQQRILESKCRICDRVGHWKAECPHKNDPAFAKASASRPPQVPTSFTSAAAPSVPEDSRNALLLEFMELPEIDHTRLDVPSSSHEVILMGILDNYRHSGVTMPDSKSQLKETMSKWYRSQKSHFPMPRTDEPSRAEIRDILSQRSLQPIVAMPDSAFSSVQEMTLFASHDSYGVVDLGATKTVIGSDNIPSLLQGIHPEVRKKLQRCKCQVTFRFGNHGTLQSQHALVVPFQGFKLKIAVVPGSTPFLLSNTLLRAIEAVIDTQKQTLWSQKLQRRIPLHITSKGLFLMDLNDLVQPIGPDETLPSEPAETHLSVESSKTETTVCASSVDHQHVTDRSKGVEDSVINKNENRKKNEVNHHSKAMKSTLSSTDDNLNQTSNSLEGSKNIAQSFQFPNRVEHVQPCSSPEESAGCGQRTTSGFLKDVTARAGRMQDRFRNQTCWRQLPQRMEPGSTLGHVADSALRELQEAVSHEVPEVCRDEDRKSRARGHRSSRDGTVTEHPCRIIDTNGNWETIHEQGQGQKSTQDASNDNGSASRGDRRFRGGHVRDAQSPGDREGCRDPMSPESHAQHRERPAASDLSPGGTTAHSGTVENDWAFQAIHEAGDVSYECYLDQTPETNQERQRFQRLVVQYMKELRDIQSQHLKSSTVFDLFEVFCDPQSSLTHQCQQQGFKAMRFSLEQGDLQSFEGRGHLFRSVVQHSPRNIWFSPTCGPWSGWSNINGSRSLQSWDELQNRRLVHLEQVALGIVLLRYQRENGHHLHWEQPQSSLMFKLPYMSELYHYTKAIDIDMCVAGDLKDPHNGKPIKKGLTIMTTSEKLSQSLKGLRCPGNHDHQIIEGSVVVNGHRLNRSAFTERYPRRFARKVANLLCSRQLVIAKPVYYTDHQEDLECILGHDDDTNKRRRIAAPPKAARTITVDDQQPVKRLRLSEKQSPMNAKEAWTEVFSKVDQLLPRVGRRPITDAVVVQLIRNLMIGKEVKRVIACRGTNRTLGPPSDLVAGEAPYRKGVYQERHEDRISMDQEWDLWEQMSQRQLTRPSPASRISITVFAANPKADITIPAEVPEEEVKLPSDNSPEPRSNPAVSLEEMPMSKSQIADLQSKKQPVSFQQLPRNEQAAILRAHRNLGHPSAEKLSTIMRQQGFRAEVVRAAAEMRCSVCDASVEPKHARPSVLRDDLDFNDRISIDGFRWTNGQGKNFHVYHVIDWSTSFHVSCIAPSRTTDDVIQNLITMWFQWAGSPSEMIVDAGSEFNSQEFMQFVQSHNIKLNTISPEAHFQNGKSERHGAILQRMLSKYDLEHPINNYQDLQRSLWFCNQAKNSCGLRKGYSPETLVLGKQTRLPGSVASDHLLPAHLLADSDCAVGLKFRQQLELRECARRAYHTADNDAALRRAVLRRSNPFRGNYRTGEWVMVWKQGNGALPGQWIGPMKVVVHENNKTIWTTMASKLYRCAPEHVRPVTASEAQTIVLPPNDPSTSEIAKHLGELQSQGITQAIDLSTEHPVSVNPTAPGNGPESIETEGPMINAVPDNPSTPDGQIPSISSNQPDQEQEPDHHNSASSTENLPANIDDISEDPAAIPIPSDDDELICEGLWCVDIPEVNHESLNPFADEAWRMEILISEDDINAWRCSEQPEEMAFLVTAARKQRSEVKMSQLSNSEKEEFQKAKTKEISNWLKTNTVTKILRNKLSPEQILRCRWILTWKPLDPSDIDPKDNKDHKAKARLVVLGYLDPLITEVPRDAPTLNRHTRMLILQLIASKSWNLQSFDISAAFLQGKPQGDRVIGLEPVPELMEALKMSSQEVCQLTKGAYGLIDAPFLWYTALKDELVHLGFEICPMDPCVFVLRNEKQQPDGILGVHVDDGICGGNQRFQQKIDELEKKYPFGSKKISKFTFTGIELSQEPGGSITMSQSKYIRGIEPIAITRERRSQMDSKVTEEERQKLRAVIGSLQYAAVHTRPDLSSRLSFLQSAINQATVGTLIEANQAVYEAKKHHDVSIVIQNIRPEDLRFLAFSDASFASKRNPESHTGSLIMSTHKDINRNVTCPVSALSWGCKKVQRVVTSTLAAETVSLNTVLDHLSWLKLCWAWFLDNRVQWKSPSNALRNLPESYSTATIKALELPESVAATDCKSLYDLVTRTAPPSCTEFRTALNARQIKDLLAEGTSLRWVHSGAQLADCLTKVMETSFLRETLKIGKYRLNDELQVLKDRSNARNRLKWLRSNCEPTWVCNDGCFLEYL